MHWTYFSSQKSYYKKQLTLNTFCRPTDPDFLKSPSTFKCWLKYSKDSAKNLKRKKKVIKSIAWTTTGAQTGGGGHAGLGGGGGGQINMPF